jgi:hypothetical protein
MLTNVVSQRLLALTTVISALSIGQRRPQLPRARLPDANWRAQPPVQMDIGPVLHPDDVMAGKMDALYNRTAARDFLDVDAAITSGRYTLDQLCDLAHDADAGFDRQLFAAMLGRIGRIDRLDDEDFTAYGVGPEHVAALRQRVKDWRASLVHD